MTASPHPLVLKGRQAFQAGDVSGALSICSMRLNEAPDDGHALELKSVIQAARGDERGAEATMRQAIQYDPASPWALNDLTLLLHNQGHRAAAEAAAREAVINLPDDPQAHLQLAVILGEKDDLPAAEFHNRRALDLAGPHPQIFVNLGLTLYNQGRIEEALPVLLEAHRLQPESAQIMAHISRAFEAKRDMADAFIWLERAEALGRRTGEDFTLLRALYLSHADQPKQALELIESQGTLAGPAMLDRARLLDKLGRHEEAMHGFVTAKARLADDMGLRYDAPKVAAEFAAMKQFFTAGTMQRLPRARRREDVAQPIFILGFPRSGTTMIEQMLDAHPDVSAGGELPFVHEWRALTEDLLPGGAPFPQRLAQAEIFDYHHIAGVMRDYYLGRAETYGLTRDTLFFTDKMPLNDVYLPLIRLAFPQATIIRMVRHPLDVALSMLSHNLTHGYNAGYKIETIIEHMVAMHELNTHYDAVLGQPAVTLRYEDFVADQKGYTLRVLGQTGLGFHEATLRFHTNPRHAPTPSYAQVSKPLNSRSVNRWKPYERFFKPFLPQIGPVIEALGYQV
ncbi:tetratricopeptide repeat-containing sulfotransferase family protein [Asticcacaulis sp. 201]|uniref:tetratricopeptide repeat-containing sulfotransferase family protein n=1 Tax=Asticcacaulis sp. 201 TaxID=3028787 RepID=UPI0029168B01|nr:sulfotransferase [Asticcacaulis sp. 201]MDV6332641.1 sulfotransferase [Asticcacaulis sp. 201]